MNDQEKLDELLEIEEPSYNRNIKKKVDHLIFKKCVGIFTVFCIFTLLIFGASKLHEYIKMKNHEKWEQQQQYYNPISEDLSSDSTPLFDELVKVYTELTFPNTFVYDTNVEEIDLYTYKLTYTLYDIYTNHIHVGKPNTTIIINRSEVTEFTQTDVQATYYMDLFRVPNTDRYHKSLDINTINEIKSLPDSALVKVAISFNDYYTTSQLLELVNRYPNSKFSYGAIDSSEYNYSGHHEGVNLTNNSFTDDFLNLNNLYPNICLTSSVVLDKQTIESSYLSKLQFLLDHERFLEIDGYIFDKNKIEKKYTQATKMIEQYGELQFIGVHGLIKKQDFLDLIEKEEIQYAAIQDVKLSILQK